MDTRLWVFGVILLFHTSAEQDMLETAESPPCPKELSVEIINPHHLDNGSVLADNGVLYPPGQFWMDKSSDEESVVLHGCVCNLMKCIRKCCPENHIYAATFKGKCVVKDHPLLQPFQPNVTDVNDHEDFSKFHVLYGDPCKAGKYKLELDYDEFQFDNSGKLSIQPGDGGVHTTHGANEYCLEVVVMNETGAIVPFPCFGDEDEPTDEIHAATFLIYPIGMLISEPFLIATFLVYALIPELRNIHGMNLMSHVTSMFVAYLFLATVQLGRDSLPLDFCIAAAYIIHYSFLASFFWLNIMCFDLWWTFSGCRPMTGSNRERDHKKFIIYSLYSWGCPLIIVTVTMIMEMSPYISDDYIKPRFGKSKCWFHDEQGTWAYFYGTVAVIITANTIMFVTTALKIIQLKNETKVLKGAESKRSDADDNSQRFGLYLKLFVVMGVNWAMEVISSVAGGSQYIWYVTDLLNTLQGVLIFFIFVWKDKIRKLINKHYGDGSYKSSQSVSGRTTRVSSMRNTSVSQCDMNMSPIARKNISSVP